MKLDRNQWTDFQTYTLLSEGAGQWACHWPYYKIKTPSLYLYGWSCKPRYLVLYSRCCISNLNPEYVGMGVKAGVTQTEVGAIETLPLF